MCCLRVFCAIFNDVELLVDTSSQTEHKKKKIRVDEQRSAIDMKGSSSPSQVCGDGLAC